MYVSYNLLYSDAKKRSWGRSVPYNLLYSDGINRAPVSWQSDCAVRARTCLWEVAKIPYVAKSQMDPKHVCSNQGPRMIDKPRGPVRMGPWG